MEKILLIDGHSILNRAFYGIPDLTNSKGMHTNAVYGFLNIMFKFIEEEKPTNIAVAFDVKKPTFRHEIFKDYKGTRKPMPEELREQVPVIKDVLRAMGIRIVELPGYEADDVIGTLSKKAEANNMLVSVITGDRDLLQLASKKILIRIPKTKKGGTEVEDYYEDDVRGKYLVSPEEFIDVKALMGDTADNIPGVESVGEKTATSLIAEYHSVENLYDNIESITRKKLKEKLIEHKDMAFLSKTLAAINVNSPVELEFEDTILGDIYTEEAYELIKKLEFKSIASKFNNKESKNKELVIDGKLIEDFDEAEGIFKTAMGKKVIGLNIAGNLSTKEIVAVSLAFSDKEVYVIKKQWFVSDDYLADKIYKLLDSTNTRVCLTGLKRHLKYLSDDTKDFTNVFDNEIAAYLLNPLKDTYNYDDLSRDYLEIIVPSRQELIEKMTDEKAVEDDIEDFVKYMSYSALIELMTADVLVGKLKSRGQLKLFI